MGLSPQAHYVYDTLLALQIFKTGAAGGNRVTSSYGSGRTITPARKFRSEFSRFARDLDSQAIKIRFNKCVFDDSL